jgi:type VI secretion system protein ImpL
MWIVLGGLLVLIAWALYWVLGLAMWIPITSTIVVVIGLIVLALSRWALAHRAAKKLESALMAQGAQQALNARPERRAEIQELQKQLLQGIGALKSSKLGKSGKKGAAALYSMPWYMIIGPPGAGKTTALKHSGLIFPYGGQGGGGVRGVGGTRNCDWWFTNEAILLDTAGRYTTENDDRDEWISFLQFLKKYRSKHPINGVLVAISISELIDSSEQQIEATGKKLRARIDEVMTQLQMVVPVYVLFTKVDLVAGFSEFFGDLKKSDRAQAWGATLRLDMPKNEPGRLFDAEFDTLVKQVHARAMRRLVMERSREAREKIYQFPLEFAGLKKNLSDLLAVTFAPNAFQGTPIFRGVYFTSGTQEGRPLDRVLGRMSAAMGIRMEAAQAPQVIESKSYFLHDVFMNIVFPDATLAARTTGEIRRRMVMRVAIAGAAFALAAILALPAASSYLNNKAFLQDTEKRATAMAGLDWFDGKPPSQKFPSAKPALERLKELDKHRAEGVPWGMGWMMYSGDRVYRPMLAVYVDNLQKGFVVPSKEKLEERLKTANGEKYLRDRTTLKMYLMLFDIEHLDVEWATGRYTQLWAEVLKPVSDVSDAELRDFARPHVEYYFQLLKEGRVQPLGHDKDLVERVRRALQNVPVSTRYYDLFVNSLSDERIDEALDPTYDNLVFKPVSLPRIFNERSEALKFIESKRFKTEQRWQEVEGPYTEKGRAAVVAQLEKGGQLLEYEGWVVPLTKEESPEKIPKYLATVAKTYESTYINQWESFFTDLKVMTPTTPDEAIDLYRVLSEPEFPYRTLLLRLEDHTQWKTANPLEGNDAIAREVNRKFNQRLNMYTHGVIVNVDLKAVGKKTSRIPLYFRKTSTFGSSVGRGDTAVFQYAELLKKLRQKILEQKAQNPLMDLRSMNDQLDEARKEADALLNLPQYDEVTKKLIRSLLLDPLNVGVRPTLGGVDPNKIPPVQKPPTGGGWQMPGRR